MKKNKTTMRMMAVPALAVLLWGAGEKAAMSEPYPESRTFLASVSSGSSKNACLPRDGTEDSLCSRAAALYKEHKESIADYRKSLHANMPFAKADEAVSHLSQAYGIPVQIISLIAKQESGNSHFKPDGTVKVSHKGAVGLYQITKLSFRDAFQACYSSDSLLKDILRPFIGGEYDNLLEELYTMRNSLNYYINGYGAIIKDANNPGIQDDLVLKIMRYNRKLETLSRHYGMVNDIIESFEDVAWSVAHTSEVLNAASAISYFYTLCNYFSKDGSLDAHGLKLSLASYNAGRNAILKYKGVPPFKETQKYLAKILDPFLFENGLLRVPHGSSISQLAQKTGLRVSDLKSLNRHLYKRKPRSGEIIRYRDDAIDATLPLFMLNS